MNNILTAQVSVDNFKKLVNYLSDSTFGRTYQIEVEEGYQIDLARSRQDDPKLQYRKEVEIIIQDDRGEIDFIGGEIEDLERECLEIHRVELGLSIEEAERIENEVMEPHRQRRKKLQQYETLFSKAVKISFPLRENDRRNLKRIQNRLSLPDEDVRRIEAKIAPNIPEPEIEPEPEPEPEPEIELQPEVGVDYSKLKELLSQGKWEEADIETYHVMLQAGLQDEKGDLDFDSIQKFPCADLQTIDQLWVKYSSGRFGFSVQKKIYRECGAKPDGDYPGYVLDDFCKQVGWVEGENFVEYDKLTFDINAPEGHFPAAGHLPGGYREWSSSNFIAGSECVWWGKTYCYAYGSFGEHEICQIVSYFDLLNFLLRDETCNL